jgi:putative nucleotidyltransferase with HDIG domain
MSERRVIAAPPRPLWSQLRAQRRDIAMSLLDGALRRSEVTVGNELLALAFVDRFADAVEYGNWPAFLGWIDQVCEKHAGSPWLARLLTRGIGSLAASLEATAHSRTGALVDFAALAAEVRQIADRPRFPLLLGNADALDEIDVALDRLMSRLTNFDAATTEHSRAVSMWCLRIGRRMGLSPRETTFVTRAGLIHDIGKLHTPAEILNAPYRLSDHEMTIMREHAAAGAQIVQDVPLLAELTPTVRAHHERVDGRGYPDGLEASQIPIVVRIVSVADSFNAMIGNRPYRPPLAPTIALEQLRLHSGTQFDPNVVSAMIEVVNRRR